MPLLLGFALRVWNKLAHIFFGSEEDDALESRPHVGAAADREDGVGCRRKTTA